MSNASTNGIPVTEGSEFVLDLNGYKIEVVGPGTGSGGKTTIGFQLLKDSTIIIKNGTMKVLPDEGIKMLIQNYSNLTLDNVKLYGCDTVKYVLSNNYGNIIIKNGTEIHPTDDNVAFDVYYGLASVYDSGVSVTIPDNSVIIDGRVEYDKDKRVSIEALAEHGKLTIPEDMELEVSHPEGFDWKSNGDGSKSLALISE